MEISESTRAGARARLRANEACIVVGAWWRPLRFASDTTAKSYEPRQIAAITRGGAGLTVRWESTSRTLSAHTLLRHWEPCPSPAAQVVTAPGGDLDAGKLTPSSVRVIVDAAIEAAMPRIQAACLAAVREAFRGPS